MTILQRPAPTSLPVPDVADAAPPQGASTLLLTLDEVAEGLRCTRRSVERQIAAGRIVAVHIGRAVRVERREVLSFVARLRTFAARSDPKPDSA